MSSFSFYASVLCLCLILAFKSSSKQVAYFSHSIRYLWLSHLKEVSMCGGGYSGIKSRSAGYHLIWFCQDLSKFACPDLRLEMKRYGIIIIVIISWKT